MNRILVVEEERSIRLAMCYTLNEAGFEVDCTESFSEGYNLLQSNNFNLIIVNYSELKKGELSALLAHSIPVIFITDLFDLPSSIIKSNPSMAKNLSFPFPRKALLTEIGNFLNKNNLKKEPEEAALTYQHNYLS